MTPSDPIPSENGPSEIDRLRAELDELKKEKSRRQEREEFEALFPGESMDALPEEVIAESASKGLPLTAGYALYRRRAQLKQEAAALASAEAAKKSIGGIGGSDGSESGEFTHEEIAAMSRTDIRRHYKDVIRSLGGHKS